MFGGLVQQTQTSLSARFAAVLSSEREKPAARKLSELQFLSSTSCKAADNANHISDTLNSTRKSIKQSSRTREVRDRELEATASFNFEKFFSSHSLQRELDTFPLSHNNCSLIIFFRAETLHRHFQGSKYFRTRSERRALSFVLESSCLAYSRLSKEMSHEYQKICKANSYDRRFRDSHPLDSEFRRKHINIVINAFSLTMACDESLVNGRDFH